MDRRYGRTSDQGYGRVHQQLRKAWEPRVRAGTVDCARCGERIERGQRWDLGHAPGSRKAAYRGPEHRSCNRSTADERGTPHDPPPRPWRGWTHG